MDRQIEDFSTWPFLTMPGEIEKTCVPRKVIAVFAAVFRCIPPFPVWVCLQIVEDAERNIVTGAKPICWRFPGWAVQCR